MDEIAADLGIDPVQFRLRYLTDKRIIDVLVAATKKAAWKERPIARAGLLRKHGRGAGRNGGRSRQYHDGCRG